MGRYSRLPSSCEVAPAVGFALSGGLIGGQARSRPAFHLEMLASLTQCLRHWPAA